METLTIHNIKDGALIKIGKFLGISLSFREPKTRDEIEEIIKLRGKYDDFCQIINFLNKTKRNDPNSFMFKVKKIVGNHINSQSFYKDCDIKELKSKVNKLKGTLKYNKSTSYAISENDGKSYLSIDIRSANFTSLKRLSTQSKHSFETIQVKTWSDYLRSLIPNDTRSNSKRNQENGTAGLVFEIPNCIYESKFFRQFILGDLHKLRFAWELTNLQLLSKFCDLNLDNRVCVNSDELIIEISNFEEADKIVNLLNPNLDVFRIRKFRLQSIKYNERKNYMLKIHDDDSRVLVNIIPDDFDGLYRTFYL